MGEYITIDGVTVKLGTCEDLYYVRYSQLADAIAAGRCGFVEGNLPPANT